MCDSLPSTLFNYLRAGSPALLLTVNADGYPHLAYTWGVARDEYRLRFAVDCGGTTLANLKRDERAVLQIGAGDLIFLIRGAARLLKDRLAATPFAMALTELTVSEVKDQAWGGVTISPLMYQWPAETREAMRAVERAVYAELRDHQTVK